MFTKFPNALFALLLEKHFLSSVCSLLKDSPAISIEQGLSYANIVMKRNETKGSFNTCCIIICSEIFKVLQRKTNKKDMQHV